LCAPGRPHLNHTCPNHTLPSPLLTRPPVPQLPCVPTLPPPLLAPPARAVAAWRTADRCRSVDRHPLPPSTRVPRPLSCSPASPSHLSRHLACVATTSPPFPAAPATGLPSPATGRARCRRCQVATNTPPTVEKLPIASVFCSLQ
jgi:hypothetical protein